MLLMKNERLQQRPSNSELKLSPLYKPAGGVTVALFQAIDPIGWDSSPTFYF